MTKEESRYAPDEEVYQAAAKSLREHPELWKALADGATQMTKEEKAAVLAVEDFMNAYSYGSAHKKAMETVCRLARRSPALSNTERAELEAARLHSMDQPAFQGNSFEDGYRHANLTLGRKLLAARKAAEGETSGNSPA
jgi:hypothetical protein